MLAGHLLGLPDAEVEAIGKNLPQLLTWMEHEFGDEQKLAYEDGGMEGEMLSSAGRPND